MAQKEKDQTHGFREGVVYRAPCRGDAEREHRPGAQRVTGKLQVLVAAESEFPKKLIPSREAET